MQKTALITLGRLPKAYEIARALHLAGWRVIIAEPWGWHLCRSSRHVARCLRVPPPRDSTTDYLAAMATIVRAEHVDLVVPVSEEIFHASALHSRLPDQTQFFCAPTEQLLRLHNKLHFQQFLRENGMRHTETWQAGSTEAHQLASRVATIAKPQLGSAGRGVVAAEAGDAPPSEDSHWLIQEYLAGEELSTFSICDNGRVIGTVVYRSCVRSGSVAVCFERITDPDPDLLAWIGQLVEKLSFNGFISFDLRRDASGVLKPMECNPRATSGIHFVDERSLAAAISDPASTAQLHFRKAIRLQQFYPTLTEAQGAVLARRARWKDFTPYLFGTADVCWHKDDPLTFICLPLASWEILRRTVFHGKSFGEATTEDIGYYA